VKELGNSKPLCRVESKFITPSHSKKRYNAPQSLQNRATWCCSRQRAQVRISFAISKSGASVFAQRLHGFEGVKRDDPSTRAPILASIPQS
jgi:hypothetical protein